MKKGFTLVEMLIVVVIIGILVAALIPRLVGAQSQARDVARKKHLADISTALELLYNDIGQYSAGDCTYHLDGSYKIITGAWGGPTSPTSQKFYNLVELGYISNLPQDPQKRKHDGDNRNCGQDVGGEGYYGYNPFYAMQGSEQTVYGYVLAANMENLKNDNYVFDTMDPNGGLNFPNWISDYRTYLDGKICDKVEIGTGSCKTTNQNLAYYIRYSERKQR